MKKWLSLLAIIPTTISSCACLSTEESDDPVHLPGQVEKDDHSGLDEFANKDYDISNALPDYLINDSSIEPDSVPTNSWTNINGIVAPFITETIDEFQSIIYYQQLINRVNGALFLSKLFLSESLESIEVPGTDIDVQAKIILDNPFGSTSGLGYGSKVTAENKYGIDVDIELETYFNLNSNLEVCVNSKVIGGADLFDYDVANVTSLIGTCYNIFSGTWARTYIANVASTIVPGVNAYYSFSHIANTINGLDIYTARKTQISNYNRFIRIRNGASFEISTSSNAFWTDKLSFSASNDKGHLVFETDIYDNDYISKWYMSSVTGWSKLDYFVDYSGVYDRFELELENGGTSGWNSGSILNDQWGSDDKRFFINGKDTVKQTYILNGQFEYVDVIHPYIETRQSKYGYGVFNFPELTGTTGSLSDEIESNGEIVLQDFNDYEFDGKKLIDTQIDQFVGQILSWI